MINLVGSIGGSAVRFSCDFCVIHLRQPSRSGWAPAGRKASIGLGPEGLVASAACGAFDIGNWYGLAAAVRPSALPNAPVISANQTAQLGSVQQLRRYRSDVSQVFIVAPLVGRNP